MWCAYIITTVLMAENKAHLGEMKKKRGNMLLITNCVLGQSFQRE